MRVPGGGDFDGAGGLSPETEEVLRRAREGGRMPPVHKRRLKGAVLARIAFASASLAAGPVAVSAMSVATKVVVGLAVVGTLGAGSYVALRPAKHHAAPAVVAARVVAPAPAPEPAPPPVVEPAPAPRAVPRPRRPVERRAVVPTTSTLVEETTLLRDADRALRAGDTATALARLDQHATRFPKGVLSPERDAERFVVLCELHAADPRAVAQFLTNHPGSLLAARVRRACAAETAGR
jgi:hypothetical protein